MTKLIYYFQGTVIYMYYLFQIFNPARSLRKGHEEKRRNQIVKLCFPAKRSKTGRSRKLNLCPKKVYNQAHFDYVIQTIHM